MSHDDTLLDPIESAIEAIAEGRPVLVVDDADRENEGDIIFAADAATDELMGATVRLGSGVICVAMTGEELDRLALPPMTAINEDSKGTAYSVSATGRGDLARPGHVFPLRARDGGVLVRRGHTEAAVDLCRLAGRAPAGVICEVVEEDGSMSRLPQLRRLADERGWPLVSIADLVDLRRRSEALVERVVSTRLPTAHGEFTAHGFRSGSDGSEHIALVHGDITTGTPLVRVHSECLTGDVFGSLRCDCGPQLDAAQAAVVAAGSGVIVYVRGHEGRGIGLVDKLRAYAAQDAGADTVDANSDLGLPVDARDYTHAAQMLRDLGVESVRLLSNNPAKVSALTSLGVEVVERVGLPAQVTTDNLRYLRTKRDRMGHDLPWLPGTDDEGSTP